MGAVYSERVDWVEELIAWFENIDPASYQVDVPNCPGWTVANLVAHVAIDGFDWVTLATHPPASSTAALGRARVAFPHEGGASLLSGTTRTFLGLLRSHDGADHCHYPLRAEQSYMSWATHAATELKLHQLDIQNALGFASPVPEPQAGAGLEWTTQALLPVVARVVDDEPAGSILLAVDGGEVVLLGGGEPVAEVGGTAVDLLLHLWNRGRDVEVTGDRNAADWWAGLMGRTFQHPTLK